MARTKTDPTRFPRPPVLPAGAIGFLTTRHDRPGRLALYRPDGTLSNTFGFDDTPRGIAESIGATLEAIEGHGRSLWAVMNEGSR